MSFRNVRYICHGTEKGAPCGAPLSSTSSENLFTMQYEIEALALFLLVDAQAYQRLGDVEQDQRADAAIDQRGGDALALDPKLRQSAWAAIRGGIGRRQRSVGEHA